MRFGTIYKIYTMFKRILDYLKKNFVLIIVVIFLTAILDLIGLGGKSDFGAGFVLGFLLVFGVILYNILKK